MSSEKKVLWRVISTSVVSCNVTSLRPIESKTDEIDVKTVVDPNVVFHRNGRIPLTKHAAATRIQMHVRRHLAQQQVAALRAERKKQQMQQRQHRAALLIQSAQRRRSAVKKVQGIRALNLHDLLEDPEAVKNLDNISALIAKKADLEFKSEEGYNALILACYFHDITVVQRLIELKANLNVRGPQGETPLIAAASRGAHELFTMLLEHKACRNDVNAQENEFGSTALLLLCQEIEENPRSCETIRCLFEKAGKSVDVNKSNKHGATPLMMAVDCREYDLVKILLDRGADRDAVATNGATALSIADSNQDDKMWYMLGGK